MSRQRDEAKKKLTSVDKRSLDIRRACLIAHVVLSGLLVVGVKLGWYTVYFGDKVLAAVAPGDGLRAAAGTVPFVDQARWLVLAAVVAFFFTSYDLVANADFQWAPLLASAFSLGICGQVCFTLDRNFEAIVREPVVNEMLERMRTGKPLPDDKPSVAPTTSSTALALKPGDGSAGATPSSVAPTTSASSSTVKDTEPQARLRIDLGLKLCLVASAGMALLSTWLTFFARRET